MLGNVLKNIRFCKNLSVKAVSTKTNLASTYVCDIEAGRRNPSLQMLEKIANCYDIEVSKIVFFHELEDSGKSRYEVLKAILEYYIEKEKTV